MSNRDFAALLYEIADYLELQQVRWEPIAYRKAARAIEALPEDLSKMYARGGLKELMEIPGVGKAIASHIEEWLKTGKLGKIEKLRAKQPPGLVEMMQLGGLGPKKAVILYKKLGIKSVADLEKALLAHKLLKLKGFGAKTEQNLSASLSLHKTGQKRFLLGEALPIARAIVSELGKLNVVKQVQHAGSLRRGKETVGDIDILVTATNAGPVMEKFTKLPEVARVLAKGPTRSAVVLKTGMQADVRVLKPGLFGAALQYFTGNVDHNVATRGIAVRKGLKLSEYGLVNRKTGKMVAGKTEDEVYKALGFKQTPPPELRESRGEIEAALKGKLPQLVQLADLRGDFHMHTRWSDGDHDPEQMITAAKARGYQYVAITDHSQSQYQAHGMDPRRFERYLATMRALQKSTKGIRVLVGSEVDILPDGSLDYPDDLLKKLDIVVASVHSRLKDPKEKMTKRITTALENKYVDILGHPSGRLLFRREPLQADWDQIFQVAADRKVALEIDSLPDRLDLKDEHVRRAKEFGCKFTIDSDSHDANHLGLIEFGVITARRGWAGPADIINTRPLKELPRFFRKL